LSDPQFVNLQLAVVAPSLLASSVSVGSQDPSAHPVEPDATQPEWAAEAISNLRHVVAGISFAFLIEAAAAVAIIATWGLWHIR